MISAHVVDQWMHGGRLILALVALRKWLNNGPTGYAMQCTTTRSIQIWGKLSTKIASLDAYILETGDRVAFISIRKWPQFTQFTQDTLQIHYQIWINLLLAS